MLFILVQTPTLSCSAREIKLIKTGGSQLIYYNNLSQNPIPTLATASDYISPIFDSDHQMRFTEPLPVDVNRNWTEMFRVFVNWVMNEQAINLMELKFERYGIDSLNAADQNDIYTLANCCPFVEGSAVYKARILWSNFEPDAVFDDRVLCIAGQNKNTDYTNVDIDSLYESQIQVKETGIEQIIKKQPVSLELNDTKKLFIYPNPVIDEIYLNHNFGISGDFYLINNLGQQILQAKISAVQNNIINLHDIVDGLYYYICVFESGEKMFGKLNISMR